MKQGFVFAVVLAVVACGGPTLPDAPGPCDGGECVPDSGVVDRMPFSLEFKNEADGPRHCIVTFTDVETVTLLDRSVLPGEVIVFRDLTLKPGGYNVTGKAGCIHERFPTRGFKEVGIHVSIPLQCFWHYGESGSDMSPNVLTGCRVPGSE